MQFALLIYHSPQEFAMREIEYNHPHLAAWRAYHKARVEAGVYVTGNRPHLVTSLKLQHYDFGI